MSPDIEWHIGEESDQETVVKTQSRPPSRWHKLALLMVVVLGAGLGLTYVSIPEPPPPPPAATPFPTVTLSPNTLELAVRHDVYILADNAGQDNFDLMLSRHRYDR